VPEALISTFAFGLPLLGGKQDDVLRVSSDLELKSPLPLPNGKRLPLSNGKRLI
jgi:hypothetical protein